MRGRTILLQPQIIWEQPIQFWCQEISKYRDLLKFHLKSIIPPTHLIFSSIKPIPTDLTIYMTNLNNFIFLEKRTRTRRFYFQEKSP